MQLTYIQLLYVGVLAVNLIIVAVLLIKTRKPKVDRNNPDKGDDSDDEGGLEESFDPVLDLPPGVILPIDTPIKDKEPVS